MNAARTSLAAYDAQLSRYAMALAAGQIRPVLPDLVAGSRPADVQRYVDNAVGERVRMLVEDTQLVGLVIEELPAKAAEYVALVPRGAYEFGRRETPQFLIWLRNSTPLNAQQADFVAYQLAEFACLELAHAKRDEYLRFVAGRGSPSAVPPGQPAAANCALMVNPIRAWSWLQLAAGGQAACEPRPTLFFAHHEQIQHLVLPPLAADYLRRLEALAPCAPLAFARECGLPESEASSLAAAWIERGIVSLTPPEFLE